MNCSYSGLWGQALQAVEERQGAGARWETAELKLILFCVTISHLAAWRDRANIKVLYFSNDLFESLGKGDRLFVKCAIALYTPHEDGLQLLLLQLTAAKQRFSGFFIHRRVALLIAQYCQASLHGWAIANCLKPPLQVRIIC